MAITVKHLLDHMRSTLAGGSMPRSLDEVGILNQAGEHLYSMHAWRFAQGRSTLLNLRGTVSATAATWTSGTLTLSKTGAFTNYTFVDGDEVEITDGTGVTTGFYEVASRTSDNAIVLASSIGTTASDVAFTLQPYSVDLPDDTRDIISIQGTGATRYHVTLTSLAEVLRVREDTGTNDAHWYASLAYVGTPPTPILEIAPGSSSNAAGALRMFYRSRWARLTTDSTTVDIPEYIEPLLVGLVRAFARGYVREDQASLDARLSEIHAGPIFAAARKSDGAIQPYISTTRNGIERWRGTSTSSWHETTSRISGPI